MEHTDSSVSRAAPRFPWRRLTDTWFRGVSWCFAAMAAATGYEVVARYVFGSPTIWVTELTTLLCAAAFLISGTHAMGSDSHLSITILSEIAPRRVKLVLAAIKLVAILTFCTGLTVFGFDSGWEPLVTWERLGTEWNPPTPAVIKPLIVLVSFVMAVQAVVNFCRFVRQPRSGKE